MEFFARLLPENLHSLARLDLFLNIIHLSLIFFIIFGAFFKKLVPVHFAAIIIIWLSWVGLGLYIGYLGYCPLTDWHWQVKAREGQVNLPSSYIAYWYDYLSGGKVDNKLISNLTAIVMLVISLFSGWRFFLWVKNRKAEPVRRRQG